MSEPEPLEPLLRAALAQRVVPSLSSQFDTTLTRRLEPPRLSPAVRRRLGSYTLVTTVVSAGAMALVGMDWRLATGFLSVPLVVFAVLVRRFFRAA